MGKRTFRADKYISKTASGKQWSVGFYDRTIKKIKWLACTATKDEAIEIYKLYELDWYHTNPGYLPKGISVNLNKKTGTKRFLVNFNHPTKKGKTIHIGVYYNLEIAQKARMGILSGFLEDLG